MDNVHNFNYNKTTSFVNSFDLADYIMTNYPKPLYLTQLLSILYFYQIGSIIFNRATPFEDVIRIKNNFIYIEDISTKYKKYKRRDLTKITIHKLSFRFSKKTQEFLIKIINCCSAMTEIEIINIVLESYLFKLSNLTVKKIINFKCMSYEPKNRKNFKAENAFLSIFLEK